jgi:hypothetical protein
MDERPLQMMNSAGISREIVGNRNKFARLESGRTFAPTMGGEKPMAPFRTHTAALLLAGITLTAVPAFAQQSGRGNGRATSRQAEARVAPRERADSGGRSQSPQTASPQWAQAQPRVSAQARAESQQRIEPVQRPQASARVEPRTATNTRTYDSRTNDNRYAVRRPDDHRYDGRRYHYDNHVVVVRPYAHTYVVPYGYRPYGYRPGWSLNLYFGRPYVAGYPAGYGYYAIRPGVAYGALRIVDAPRDAQVFVDGYYAGVVDDYDGVFQHLNLEAGPHRIEIDVAGFEPIDFDVNVSPGQTITYRAQLL